MLVRTRKLRKSRLCLLVGTIMLYGTVQIFLYLWPGEMPLQEFLYFMHTTSDEARTMRQNESTQPSNLSATKHRNANETKVSSSPRHLLQQDEITHHLLGTHPFSFKADDYLCEPSGQWNLTLMSQFVVGQKLAAPPPPRSVHRDVMRSILAGLKQQHLVVWNANPLKTEDVNEVIWLVDCVEHIVDQVTRWFLNACKAPQCRAKMIICGPIGNLYKGKYMKGLEHVEFTIGGCPSAGFGLRFYFGNITKSKVLVSGIDENFWKPTKPKDPEKVVFYVKKVETNQMRTMISETKARLAAENFTIESIEYGKYKPDSYRSKLDGASFAVVFTPRETQGISLVESWAMNVPTFVFVPAILPAIFGKSLHIWGLYATSAPYINEETGFLWNNLDNLISFMKSPVKKFTPRNYVLRTMTDAIAQYNTLRAIECSWRKKFARNS